MYRFDTEEDEDEQFKLPSSSKMLKQVMPITLMVTTTVFSGIAFGFWFYVDYHKANPWHSIPDLDKGWFATVKHVLGLQQEGHTAATVIADGHEPDVGLAGIITSSITWFFYLIICLVACCRKQGLNFFSDSADDHDGYSVVALGGLWFLSGLCMMVNMIGLLFFTGMQQMTAIYCGGLIVMSFYLTHIHHPVTHAKKLHMWNNLLIGFIGIFPYGMAFGAMTDISGANILKDDYFDKFDSYIMWIFIIGLLAYIALWLLQMYHVSQFVRTEKTDSKELETDGDMGGFLSIKNARDSAVYAMTHGFYAIVWIVALGLGSAYESENGIDSKKGTQYTYILGQTNESRHNIYIIIALLIYFGTMAAYHIICFGFALKKKQDKKGFFYNITSTAHFDFVRVFLVAISNMFLTMTLGWAGAASEKYEIVGMIGLGLITDLSWYNFTYHSKKDKSFQTASRFFVLFWQVALNLAVPAWMLYKVDAVDKPENLSWVCFHTVVWASSIRLFVVFVQGITNAISIIGKGCCGGKERPCFARWEIFYYALPAITFIPVLYGLREGHIFRD